VSVKLDRAGLGDVEIEIYKDDRGVPTAKATLTLYCVAPMDETDRGDLSRIAERAAAGVMVGAGLRAAIAGRQPLFHWLALGTHVRTRGGDVGVVSGRNVEGEQITIKFPRGEVTETAGTIARDFQDGTLVLP
jgi:hypothetical protein